MSPARSGSACPSSLCSLDFRSAQTACDPNTVLTLATLPQAERQKRPGCSLRETTLLAQAYGTTTRTPIAFCEAIRNLIQAASRNPPACVRCSREVRLVASLDSERSNYSCTQATHIVLVQVTYGNFCLIFPVRG